MNIVIESGIKELIGKKVRVVDEPYADGDTVVCIQKNNFNYGYCMIHKAAPQLNYLNDFVHWKKIDLTSIK